MEAELYRFRLYRNDLTAENAEDTEREEGCMILMLTELILFPDDEDSPENIAEIEAARADYKAGDYITFDEYTIQRARKSKSTNLLATRT